MKLKVIPMLFMLLMAGNAAALCDLKVSALDLRDGGLSLDDDAVIRSNNGDPLGDCPLTVRATNLPNPRSSALREFRGTGYESFSQKIEIKNLALTGVGSLRFMSFNFFANQLRYRLDLSVSQQTTDTRFSTNNGHPFFTNKRQIESQRP